MVNHFVPDVLGISLQRVIAQARVQALTYYVYGASMPHFRDALGADADGVIWSTVTGLYEDPLGRDFRARYRRRFGTDAGWSHGECLIRSGADPFRREPGRQRLPETRAGGGLVPSPERASWPERHLLHG